MPTPSRAAFIIANMARMPLCGSPMSQPWAPSKFMTQVADALMPILCSIEPQAHAIARTRLAIRVLARNFGTRNRLMPFTPVGASDSLRQHEMDDVLA